MAKLLINAVLDSMLDELATCDRLDLSSDAAPVDLSGSLVGVAVTPGEGNGDYTIADGTPNGRTLTISAKSGLTTTAAGTPLTAVLSLGGVIKGYVTCSGDDTVVPGTANISAFTLRGADPI